MKRKLCLFAVLLIFTAMPLIWGSGSERVPFPEDIPLEHFSYFQYPTDVLGFKDSREGAEITPEGNIYTGYTEMIFLHGDKLNLFPLRKHFWLEREYLPIHHWKQTIDGMEYRFSAFAFPLLMNPENNLLIFVKLTVTNRSGSNRTRFGRIAIGTRYVPPESEGSGRYAPSRHRFRRPESPIRPGYYLQEGERFSADWRFMFRGNSLQRDGKILFTYSPGYNVDQEFFSYRGYKTDPEKAFNQPVIASSPVGIARFSKKLAPGESFDVYIKMPYTPVEADSAQTREINALRFSRTKERVAGFWDNVLSRGMTIELPEPKPVHVYNTSLIYDLIARDKVGNHYIQKVNEFHYDEFWLRDSAYIARSYDLGGYHQLARECLEFFFRWQREDGNFMSQGGQYDGWGQTLWIFSRHYLLTGNRSFGLQALDAIMRAAAWLDKTIDKDPLGIIPKTTPGDNEDITDGHVTGHNIWALAGLKGAVDMAEHMGKNAEANHLRMLYRKLNQNFLKVLRKALKRTGNYIPPALDQDGGQDWGNLMAVYPEEILPPNHPAVSETLRRSRKKYREKIMTYLDTQWLHHYITLKNTETLVAKGDQQTALEEFYAVLAHTSSTHAGFEFNIRPWSNRDFHANLVPHGTFAATYRNLLRSMLVRERADTLHLLSVVSPAWAVPGEQVRVDDAPTDFGKISYTASFTKDGLELDIRPEFTRPPVSVAVHMPYFTSFVSASTGEYNNGILVLPPSTTRVSIKWKKKKNAAVYSFERMVNWLKNEYKK